MRIKRRREGGEGKGAVEGGGFYSCDEIWQNLKHTFYLPIKELRGYKASTTGFRLVTILASQSMDSNTGRSTVVFVLNHKSPLST